MPGRHYHWPNQPISVGQILIVQLMKAMALLLSLLVVAEAAPAKRRPQYCVVELPIPTHAELMIVGDSMIAE